jgi:hypothetical protein
MIPRVEPEGMLSENRSTLFGIMLQDRVETQVGIISDTQGPMRPEALAALAGSDLIIRAEGARQSNSLLALKGPWTLLWTADQSGTSRIDLPVDSDSLIPTTEAVMAKKAKKAKKKAKKK